MTTGSTEQINAAKDMILSLLLEIRSVMESPDCDANAASDALKEIDSALPLPKRAFMITGHAATFGDTSEDHNPYTNDGRRKHVHCVELGKTYPSAAEARRDTEVNSSNLHQALHGRLTTAGGYHWIYVDPEM